MQEKSLIEVETVLNEIKSFVFFESENLETLDALFHAYLDNPQEYKERNSKRLAFEAITLLQKAPYQVEIYYIMSFLLNATLDRDLCKVLLRFCILDREIPKETKWFLYYQIIGFIFLHGDIKDEEINDLLDSLYDQIYEAYSKEIKGSYDWISREDRNEQFVVAIISQVLEMPHAPTRILYDYSYILQKHLKKKIFIINTAEFKPAYGGILFFDASYGNYIDSYSEVENIQYKDEIFSFFQCPNMMPQCSIIEEILSVIKEEKPYFIMNVGGSSLVTELCSKMVPTITLPTVSQARERGQFQINGITPTEEDILWSKKYKLPEDHFIKTNISFILKEQEISYTRGDLGLPEDRFIAAIVGARLDWEIDHEFEELMKALTRQGIFIAVVGMFEGYQKMIGEDEVFAENSTFLGYQRDILAFYECCNLYINPKRIGGGTSAIEALYKGIPVVTCDFGDVASNIGSDFCVRDYKEMEQEVLQYLNNKEYYSIMSKKGIEKAVKMADFATDFIESIKVVEQSSSF